MIGIEGGRRLRSYIDNKKYHQEKSTNQVWITFRLFFLYKNSLKIRKKCQSVLHYLILS
jgi:hypothetical protein